MATERAVVRPKIKFGPSKNTEFSIEIDSCKEETHVLANTITDHPVEQGPNIADHVRPEPDMLTLTCFVSNLPLNNSDSSQSRTRTIKQGNVQFETSAPAGRKLHADGGRGQKTFDELRKLRDNGTLLKIYTPIRLYGAKPDEGMVIQSLTVPRTKENYDGLEFTIAFKQVRIVRNAQNKQKRATAKQAQPKKKQGAQVSQIEDSNAIKFTTAVTGEDGVAVVKRTLRFP